jgi:uncharacterized protein YdeI (YjbR/CyaY-like superfamily)
MPDFIAKALEETRLMNEYKSRPPYQQNDYIGWITRAKLKKTQEKRLSQMLRELTQGDKYMNMVYTPKKP